MSIEKEHKAGFVSIIGKPNAGKSTLMNALVGRKLAITTSKAQTTRHRILGIANEDNYQMVFSDTPGLILPQYQLHRMMMGAVKQAVEDADLLLILADVNERFPEDEVFKVCKKTKIPKLLVLNKVDLADEEKVKARFEELNKVLEAQEAIGISALHGFNVPELKEIILRYLPVSPPYFDKEMLSDRPERFFVSEMIREKIFAFLKEEIPYSVEVGILAFEEKPEVIVIHAEVYVERKSQRQILIGKGGSMIRKIGSTARKDIEGFLQKRIYLDLHVKVSENWKDSPSKLRFFGYQQQ